MDDKYIKLTIKETSSSDSDSRESSSCDKDSDNNDDDDNNETQDQVCMSPPNIQRRSTKSSKKSKQQKTKHRSTSRKSNHSKTRRHSSKRSNKHNNNNSTDTKNDTTENEDSTKQINLESSAEATSNLYHKSNLLLLSKTKSVPNYSSEDVTFSKRLICNKINNKKSSIEYRIKKTNNIEIDPFDRADSINKISLLLKLALSTRANKELKNAVPPPPSTPQSSNISYNNFGQAFKTFNATTSSNTTNQILNCFSTQTSYLSKQSSTTYSSTPSTSGVVSALPETGSSSNDLITTHRQQERQIQTDNVWKEIYDFFEYYNDRATTTSDNNTNSIDLIDKRLNEARAFIPTTVKEVLNTNFEQITTNMNSDIKEKLKTPLSYLNLYEETIYIDQLCYLYWLVEDVINRVSYIETLYPSTYAMKQNEPTYADPSFEAINKTLILWYKIMTQLMTKCDALGRFLGFEKREENKAYWGWFDKRLNYSRKEYESMQKWLKLNFTLNNKSNKSRSIVSSPVIDLTKPSFPSTTNSISSSPANTSTSTNNNNNNTNNLRQSANRHQTRQISFELHALKTPSHGYDNSESSLVDLKCDSRRGSTNHLSVDTASNSKKTGKLPSPNLNRTDLLNEFLNRTNAENNHLESVKLHHVTSFLSQNSLLTSVDSTDNSSPLSSKFYTSLIQNKLNKLESSTSLETQPPTPQTTPSVGFSLASDSDIESDALKSMANEEEEEEEEEDEKNSPPPIITEPVVSESASKREKIFQEFLHKRLRKHGLTNTFDEIRKLVLNILPQALSTLQVDYCEYFNNPALATSNADPSNYHLMPMHKKYIQYMDTFPFDEETLIYGVRSQWFQKLNLPSFRPIFLYLNNIIFELMHVCIKMQIDGKRDMKKQSNFKFSLLSIEVLTHELRECIEQAIVIRQFYYNMVYSVFDKSEMNSQQQLENDLVAFDDDLKLIIDIYLSFVTDWVHDLVSAIEIGKAIGVLQDEWSFCKNNLYFVTASEDIYAKRFCALCKTVISSLSDSLHDLDQKHKQPLMEYIANLEISQELNSLDLADLDDNSQFNSIQHETKNEEPAIVVVGELDENLEEYREDEEDEEEDENDEDEEEFEEEEMRAHNRYIHLDPGAYDINLKCNEFKEEVNQIRKRCMKALSFCSNLISDLSLAAKYSVESKIQSLLKELKQTNHVLVIFTNPELQSSQKFNSSENFILNSNNQDLSFMIFVPSEFSKDKIQIARLLFLISAKDEYENEEHNNNIIQKEEEQDQLDENKLKRIDNRVSSFRRLSSANSFLEEDSILNKLSRLANMNSASKRINTNTTQKSPPVQNKTFSNSFILSPQVVNDGYLLYLQISSNTNESWQWTGNVVKLYAALPVRKSLYQHRNQENMNNNNLNDPKSKSTTLTLVVPKSKILQQKKIELKSKLKSVSLIKEKTSFHPNIEYAIDEVKESILNLRTDSSNCIKQIEKDLKTHYNTPISISRKSPVIYQRYLSEIWRVGYNFGIDLQNECIKLMTQDQARKFSIGIADFCIMWCDYIVDKTERGKGTTVQPWAARKGIQLLQEAFEYSNNLTDSEYVVLKNAVEKCLEHVIGGRNPAKQHLISQSENLTRSNTQTGINLNKNLPPSKRFLQNCMLNDDRREHTLQDRRYIGKIHDSKRAHELITATEVNFRWQLGLKIGEGQYGKVYSCVNLDNGEPMAMKEIPFKSDDIEAIKNIYSEITNLQDVRHENLVRLYGSELHRKELLIFMEFCGDQSTLDRISKETSGLPEKIVRGYTKSLLEAVATLHENEIMHRDIKGSNIFIKAVDPKHPEKIVLKLGDFGCSIKIKNIGGSSPAKAIGFIGTFPYMAPEVMVSGGSDKSGYSYSADIWSVGCVVIEMFTGKRPWHPLIDNQILFKIHIQKSSLKPPYPQLNTISEEAVNFLDACLEFDPNKRLTADALLSHPFVKVHEPTGNDYISI